MSELLHIKAEHPHPFEIAPISKAIWELKYRLMADAASSQDVQPDGSIGDTFERLAQSAVAVERGGKAGREKWRQAFLENMGDFGFLPAGRIIAGAGSARKVTLFNCFVMGTLDDDLTAIFNSVRDAALTMQQGGGIGQDFSSLRPKGAKVRSIGAEASGPVSFMDVWDSMCRTLVSAGSRRGAMMATMRCDHPDIEAFITAKADPARLRNFNLSVLVTDAFMQAVSVDASWPLVFEGKVFKSLQARSLWDRIMEANYAYAEPGVIFIDRINATNNLGYCETIRATNPCGEQPLPPYGACLLGSINLARLVQQPFSSEARIDLARLEERVRIAVRFLDNMIDISRMPLSAQKKEARAKRRIGLGITGLADALVFCGLHYGSSEACAKAAGWMQAIQRASYLASSELAAEKGSFPLYDSARFFERPGIARLDGDVRAAIASNGMRNGCLTSIAPTGTISLLAGNVSSGIEPIFDLTFNRGVRDVEGKIQEHHVEDYAHAFYRKHVCSEGPLPEAFVTATEIMPSQHLAMQAALQPHVDSSISKTINCPENMSFDAFKDVYLEAYAKGLKGCTTFRPNPVTGAVLKAPSTSTTAHAIGLPNAKRPSRPADEAHAAEVVYLSPPLERDPSLAGFTYKLKWSASDHAIYVTINDIEIDGRRRPFEIFINTKNLEHYAWTVALTRMISAVFRRGGDVSFVFEELKAVFDPQGGQWLKGHYVPSLLAAIGEIIEEHMIRTGFLEVREGSAPLEDYGIGEQAKGRRAKEFQSSAAAGSKVEGGGCTRCGHRALFKHEGCWICHDCGYSKC